MFRDYNELYKHDKIKLHGHKIRLDNIPLHEKVIFILRDPISRFISGFYSRQREGAPRYCSKWNKAEENAFGLFNSPNELALALADDDNLKHLAAVSAMNEIRHVNSHYYDWFISKEYFQKRIDDILFIGYQESLDKDFIKIKKLIGLSNDITLPTDDFKAHKNPIDLDRNLDAIAKERLKLWYEKDYEFFYFCKNMS